MKTRDGFVVLLTWSRTPILGHIQVRDHPGNRWQLQFEANYPTKRACSTCNCFHMMCILLYTIIVFIMMSSCIVDSQRELAEKGKRHFSLANALLTKQRLPGT